MFKTLMIVATLLALTCATGRAENYGSTYTTGANGQLYEKYSVTEYRYDHCGRRYAVTVWKYRPATAYAKQEEGIEKFADQLLRIKYAEIKSELKLREQYAFAKEAAGLAEKFGITNYSIEGYGQALNYGDPALAQQGYQYPAQQGSTVYGVNEYVGDFYGEASMRLIDADRYLANRTELRKMDRQYAYEEGLSLDRHAETLSLSRDQSLSALAEMRELRASVTGLMREATDLVKALKAEPRATIQRSEAQPLDWQQPDEGDGAAIQQTVELAVTGLKTKCATCHIDGRKGDSNLFPEGVNFGDIADWNGEQIGALLDVVESGKTRNGKAMPPDGDPLTVQEKLAIATWLSERVKR